MSMSELMANPAHSTIVGIWYFGMGQPCQILLIDFSKTCVWYFRMGRPLLSAAASIDFSLFFSCEVNIGSDMWITDMHNHRLFWMLYELPGLCVWLQCTGTLKSCSNFLYSLYSFLLHILDFFQVSWFYIVNVHTFFYKIGQSRDTLTADKTCMQTRKDRREYMWNCCKRGDHPGNNASTYCFACSSNASDTGIRTNRNKFIHTRSDFK